MIYFITTKEFNKIFRKYVDGTQKYEKIKGEKILKMIYSVFYLLKEIFLEETNIPEMVQILIFLLILIVAIFALFSSSSYLLQGYGLEISKKKTKIDKIELDKRERFMFYSDITLLILLSICMAKTFFVLIPIIALCLFAIAGKTQNKKIYNILYTVILISILLYPLFSYSLFFLSYL